METEASREIQKLRKLVVQLSNEIDYKNLRIFELRDDYDQASANLQRMEIENQKLHQDHARELEELHCMKLDSEKSKAELQIERKEIEIKAMEIDKRALELNSGEEKVNLLLRELEERVADMQDLETLNQVLISKERTTNEELQEARKAVIRALQDLTGIQGDIGVKRMGEVQLNPFRDAFSKKRPSRDWEIAATELCSFWQGIVEDPEWYPFKNKVVDGKLQEVIDEEDIKLTELKGEWGEAAYAAVVNALLELNDHNASGRYVVPEVWNYREGRKARLREGIDHLVLLMKQNQKSKKPVRMRH